MTGLSVVTLFIQNLFAEHIMRHVRLGGLQAEIKIGGRNINNLRYTDDTTLIVSDTPIYWKWTDTLYLKKFTI